MINVLIDGRAVRGAAAAVSVADGAVLRGDGCFEVLRAYGGVAFEVEAHLDRMERSAAALRLALPRRDDLTAWIAEVAGRGGDCAVRVLVTRGTAIPGSDAPSRGVVISHPIPQVPDDLALLAVVAPWHPGGEWWDLAGAKTLSYGPNMAAVRHAQERGFHDALLLSRDGWILEGPTFSVGWVVEGKLELPALELAVLDSITRRVVVTDAERLGIRIGEGRFPLDRLDAAEEVLALSTIKEVRPVARVGDRRFSPGPVGEKLAAAFAERVQSIRSQGRAGR